MSCSTTSDTFDFGDLVRCTGSFTDVNGAAVDPATVGFKVKNPEGTVTPYVYLSDVQLVRDSLGHYHVDVDANMAGTWYYRFYSTGSAQAADETSFTVNPSVF